MLGSIALMFIAEDVVTMTILQLLAPFSSSEKAASHRRRKVRPKLLWFLLFERFACYCLCSVCNCT